MSSDADVARVYRRCRRLEYGFFAVLLACFAVAVIGRFGWNVELMERPWLQFPLGLTLLTGSILMVVWCESYGRYNLDTKIQPYRKFFESVYPPLLQRMYFSHSFNVLFVIIASLMFGFIGVGLLVQVFRN